MPRAGIQLEVLGLYRQLLRAVNAKDAESRKLGAVYVRAEFEKHRGVKKSNIQLIEHLVRAGRKRLALLQEPSTKMAALPKSER
jgi:succinate dehydrogenase assembly factor 1